MNLQETKPINAPLGARILAEIFYYMLETLRIEFADEIYAYISETITQRQAEDILDFVDKYHESVETLIIHCQAGRSRSQGIGVALATIYKTKRVDGPTTKPNCLVVARLLKEWEKRTQEIIESPKIYREKISCRIHPNEHLYPDRDKDGNLFGYCMNCKKIIKAYNVDLFGIGRTNLNYLKFSLLAFKSICPK